MQLGKTSFAFPHALWKGLERVLLLRLCLRYKPTRVLEENKIFTVMKLDSVDMTESGANFQVVGITPFFETNALHRMCVSLRECE